MSAAPAPFDGSVAYPDGVRLKVTGLRQGKVTGQGPGVFIGQPTTRVGLRLVNASARPLTLNRVVVSAAYGPARRLARPVYDEGSRDFNGTVRPGRSTTATYTFSVPRRQLDDVRMVVDFDGRHTVARFTGPAAGASR